jgi:hypothetical protein
VTQAIADKGGNIVAFVTSEGDDLTWRRATLKITGIKLEDMEAIARGYDDMVLEDIRE